MAITVFPSANAVGGAGQKVLSEPNLTQWLGISGRNHVVSGLDVSGIGTGTVTISPGVAYIAGRYVSSDAQVTISVSGSGSYNCRLTLTADALGLVTQATIELVTAATPLTQLSVHLASISLFIGTVSRIAYTPGRYTSPRGSVYDAMVGREVTFNTHFESIDGYATTLVSAGTVAVDTTGCLKLATAATVNSSATIAKYSYAGAGTTACPTFSNEQWLSVDGAIPAGSDKVATETWLIIGAPGIKRHIGFVILNGQAFGTIGDGIVETRTAEITGGSINWLLAHHVPGAHVEFWANIGLDGLTYVGKLTGSVPSGSESVAADRAIMYASLKTTEAKAKELRLGSWQWRQIP